MATPSTSYTVIGAAESTDNISSSRGVRDVGKGIAYVDEDIAPLTAILMKSKNGNRAARVGKSKKVEWIEKEFLRPMWDQVNGAITTGETALVVDNGSRFRANDVVQVRITGEILLVTAVSTNTLTVVRSVGDSSGTGAATIADNSDLMILGNAVPQGAAVGTPNSWDEAYVFNYTQIFRTPFGFTNTELAVENYTGDDLSVRQKEMAGNHRVDIEKSLLWGERSGQLNASTNTPQYTAGGLDYYLTANIKSSVGTLTEPEVADEAEDVFQATGGSSSRLWVMSPFTATVVDLLAGARIQTVPKEDTFGVAIRQWVTSHGTFNMITHPLLTNGVNGEGYGGSSYIVDPKKLKYVSLSGRDTKLLTNRQNPGDDKRVDEYLTECTFQIENPAYHGVITGVTG